MDNKFQTPSKFKRRDSFSQKPFTIPPSPFLEKLGYGTGVTVWKLQQSPQNNKPQSPWAIKNVRANINKTLTNKYQTLLQKEADILRSLNHENIVAFKGYIKSKDGRNCLAMELGGECLGMLIEKRFEDELGPYPASIILKVGLDVGKALKYLHEEKRILHGDIKSYNIVVKNNFDEIKLCDFGVSVNLDDKSLKEKFVGTPLYSAPECQEGAEGPITEKADIFSYGLVLWEMIALTPPHVEGLMDQSFNSELEDSDGSFNDSCFNVSDLEQNYGTRPSLPAVELGPEYGRILEIFYLCTEQTPDKRPSASQIIDWIKTGKC